MKSDRQRAPIELSEFCLSESASGGGVSHEGERVTDLVDAEQGGRAASSAAPAAIAAPRRLYWWREVLYVLAFYGVYSYIRNQFGSASVSDEVAFRNARAHHPHRGMPAHLPRRGHPERRARLALVPGLLERVLRQLPLRGHDRRAHLDVPVVPEALSPVAQHAGVHDRLRAHRLRDVPAHAAPPAARSS